MAKRTKRRSVKAIIARQKKCSKKTMRWARKARDAGYSKKKVVKFARRMFNSCMQLRGG